MTNPSNLSRDELAHLLGASTASDILATARPDNKNKNPTSRNSHHAAAAEEDVSNMDSKQAAALVARKFDRTNKASGGVAVKRYRADKKREYHVLVGDMEASMEGTEETPAVEEEDDAFLATTRKRKKVEATVIQRKDRRGDSDDDDDDDRSSTSESESSEVSSRRAPRGRRRRGSSSSSSTEASDDSADLRRRRAREKRRGREAENDEKKAVAVTERNDKEDHVVASREIVEHQECEDSNKPMINQHEEQRGNIRQSATDDKPNLKTDCNEGESSDSDSSSTSSSSSSSSDEESSIEPPPPQQTLTKPLFIPKSKRGTIAQQEMQQQKVQEAEQRKVEQKQKQILQSRALVAQAVAEKGSSVVTTNSMLGDEDEFEGAGIDNNTVPDDNDDMEIQQQERDAWEVRELIRILHEADIAEEKRKEKLEIETRRKMTDGELYDQQHVRLPGEARRNNNNNEQKGKYLQRFHHRGAFYMDEDTLHQAGKDDVRHKALEYSRAATGEDKIDKSALPEVMQVKKFGFAGYSTKYKGLAKEDTTDKSMDFVPIVRGKKKKET
eukprot:scaffold12325_cov40-Cyclotella_meneghiniana.AAC.1